MVLLLRAYRQSLAQQQDIPLLDNRGIQGGLHDLARRGRFEAPETLTRRYECSSSGPWGGPTLPLAGELRRLCRMDASHEAMRQVKPAGPGPTAQLKVPASDDAFPRLQCSGIRVPTGDCSQICPAAVRGAMAAVRLVKIITGILTRSFDA